MNQQPININSLTVEQLKALVYDENVKANLARNNINELEKVIQLRYDQLNLQKQESGEKREVVLPVEVSDNDTKQRTGDSVSERSASDKDGKNIKKV